MYCLKQPDLSGPKKRQIHICKTCGKPGQKCLVRNFSGISANIPISSRYILEKRKGSRKFLNNQIVEPSI